MAFNTKNRSTAQLETFSGVTTFAQPHDLPEGASPVTENTDFSIGSVFTRQGLQNPFTYSGNFVSNGGNEALDFNLNGVPWNNPTNVLLDTGVYATASLSAATSITPFPTMSSSTWTSPGNATSSSVYASVPATSIGNQLRALLTGTTIPTSAQITGIKVTFNAFGYGAFTGPVSAALLFGSDLTETLSTPNITSSPVSYQLGSSSSIWGQSSITPSQINAGFYVILNALYSPTTFGGTQLNNLVISITYANQETDAIDVTEFGFSVANTATPQGFEISVNNFVTSDVDITTNLTVQMLKAGIPVGVPVSSSFDLDVPGTTVIGGINDLFGASWTYADLNHTQFGVRLTAEGDGAANINVGYVTVKAYFTPTQANFDYVKTSEDDFGDIYTYALNSDGDMFVENVKNEPNVLTPLFSGIPQNSFVTSFTAASKEYLAISDGQQGNYYPTQIIGTTNAQQGWQDRVSQVGPGVAPAFQGTLSSGNVANITAYSTANNIVTLQAVNTFSPGEVITANIVSGPTFLNTSPGPAYNVLGTGLSPTQFEVSYTGSSGSGNAVGLATPQYTYPIQPSPNGVTQFPFWNQAQGYQSQLDDILWSSGPGQTSAGTVITVYYLNAYTHQSGIDLNLSNAIKNNLYPVYVYVSGTNQPVANGTQLVTGIGIGTPPGGGDERYYFTFNVPTSSYQNLGGGSNAQAGKYQLTIATLNTTLPLPGISSGDSVTLSGVTVTPWNNTWTILDALNSGVYTISQTSMSSSGVATYNWALAGTTSTPPLVGQLVTVIGTLSNLNPSGTYNVTDAVIASVTGSASGTFTVNGFGATNSETVIQSGAQAVTSGTSFNIDPGPLSFGDPNSDPIYGNSGDGFITLVGSSSPIVAQGTRRGTVCFITRNGYYTAPAPPVEFDTTSNTNYILVSNIPIGPPNVIGRQIIITEAGQSGEPGASYYTIPSPVQFIFNGQTYLSSSLIIWDNITTSAKLTFTDSVLLNEEEVDVTGNDLFALTELPNSKWNTQYAGRSVWGGVDNAIQNFVNLSFDGGYQQNLGGNITPAGWGIDAPSNPSNSPGGLLVSPIFGNSYYIENNTGNTQAQLGMITQTAYQDWEYTSILQNQTPYSVRVVARTPSGTTSGALIIDLTEYNNATGYGATHGTFELLTVDMTSFMKTYTGTLLVSNSLTIPSDLLLRVWASNLVAGGDIEIDSIQIYPTLAPQNRTGLTISYRNDWESFDGVTGGTDTAVLNSQPTTGAFEILNKLYVLKESSMGYIEEVPNQEPSDWNPYREVSNLAGACGINAYDIGEEWAIMACQNGIYGFNGGAPVAIQLEIPDIWQAINWNAGQCIVVRNDTPNKRILIAVPMTTPNQWCPDFPSNILPTSPNVILMLNYDGIGTIEELINGMAVHVTIVGKMATHDLKRKWSLWSVPTPYMNICKRDELFSEMLICNGIGSSKIYQLGSYQSGEDDSVPFTSSYTTYGFVSQEKAKESPALGLFNKRYVLYDALISGSGNANIGFFQNTLDAPYPFFTPGGIPLNNPEINDREGGLDEYGQRLFCRVSMGQDGNAGWFSLSRLSLSIGADKWAPIRGVQ